MLQQLKMVIHDSAIKFEKKKKKKGFTHTKKCLRNTNVSVHFRSKKIHKSTEKKIKSIFLIKSRINPPSYESRTSLYINCMVFQIVDNFS